MDHGKTLALDSVAYGEVSGLRRGEEFIDTLAYIDIVTEEERRVAEALIKEEIKIMGKRPKDYLPELPKLHQVKFEGHPVLQAEYERVRAGQPLTELDKLRYKCLPPPDNRKNDVSAWHAAIDNASSQLEHQYNRLLNLELLLAYGPKSWQAYIRSLEVGLKRLYEMPSNWWMRSSVLDLRLEEQVQRKKAEVSAVNSERKLKHQAAGKLLESLESDWKQLVAKNSEIAAACKALEADVITKHS